MYAIVYGIKHCVYLSTCANKGIKGERYMKKSVSKRVAFTSLFAVAAFTLAACNSSEGENTNTNEDSVTTEENTGSEDAEEQVEIKDTTVVSAVEGFFNSISNNSEEDISNLENMDTVISEAHGEEVMSAIYQGSATGDYDAVFDLISDEELAQMVVTTERYSNGVRDYVNYDELTDKEKLEFNLVVSGYKAAISLFGEGVVVTTTVDKDRIIEDGDTATAIANMTSTGLGEVSGGQDSSVLEVRTVNTSHGWKVDSSWFLNYATTQ